MADTAQPDPLHDTQGGRSRPLVSEEELNTLLTALRSVSRTSRARRKGGPLTVSLFDFRHTVQLSADQLRALETEARGFCRVLRRTLVPYLNIETDLDLLSVSVASFDQFVRSFASAPVIGVFRLAPHSALALWEVAPTIAFAVVDLMLGASEPAVHQPREITPIESAVLSRFFGELLSTWVLASSAFAGLSPSVQYVTSSASKIDMHQVEQNMVHLVIKGRVGDIEGAMNLGFPIGFLRNVLRDDGESVTVRGQPADPAVLAPVVRRVLVDVSVQLPAVRIPLSSLRCLRPGDLLPLGLRSDSHLVLAVNDRPKFVGEAGRSGTRMAVRITGPVD